MAAIAMRQAQRTVTAAVWYTQSYPVHHDHRARGRLRRRRSEPRRVAGAEPQCATQALVMYALRVAAQHSTWTRRARWSALFSRASWAWVMKTVMRSWRKGGQRSQR